MAAKKPFKDALKTIGSATVDFSQLNVRTFVGTINISSQGSGDPDWDALMKKAITDGKVSIAASTTIHIDGDCDHFEDPDQITDGLRSAHESAVAAGQAARKAIVDMVSDGIKRLIDV